MPSGVYIRTEKHVEISKRNWDKRRSKGLDKAWNKNMKLGPNPKHSERMKGKIPWNKNKKGLQIAWNIGLKGYNAGEKNGNYKGGITPINMQIRSCFEYRQWRSDVFTRDNFACVECNVRSGNGVAVYLEADHYPVMFSKIMIEYNIRSLNEALNCEKFWDINNGRTLCKNCHNKTKKGYQR